MLFYSGLQNYNVKMEKINKKYSKKNPGKSNNDSIVITIEACKNQKSGKVKTDSNGMKYVDIYQSQKEANEQCPLLPRRYHGPGCAMEVNIMEKHQKCCDYKKQENSSNTPEDKVGSYDCIGRFVFRTCDKSKDICNNEVKNCKSSPQLEEKIIPEIVQNSLDKNHSDEAIGIPIENSMQIAHEIKKDNFCQSPFAYEFGCGPIIIEKYDGSTEIVASTTSNFNFRKIRTTFPQINYLSLRQPPNIDPFVFMKNKKTPVWNDGARGDLKKEPKRIFPFHDDQFYVEFIAGFELGFEQARKGHNKSISANKLQNVRYRKGYESGYKVGKEIKDQLKNENVNNQNNLKKISKTELEVKTDDTAKDIKPTTELNIQDKARTLRASPSISKLHKIQQFCSLKSRKRFDDVNRKELPKEPTPLLLQVCHQYSDCNPPPSLDKLNIVDKMKASSTLQTYISSSMENILKQQEEVTTLSNSLKEFPNCQGNDCEQSSDETIISMPIGNLEEQKITSSTPTFKVRLFRRFRKRLSKLIK